MEKNWWNSGPKFSLPLTIRDNSSFEQNTHALIGEAPICWKMSTHISALYPQVLQTIFHFLEWTHFVKLLATRDRRMCQVFARVGILKSIVFDKEVEEELPLSMWLLKAVLGVESVTLCPSLGGAQRLLPSLSYHNIESMVVECPLHDGLRKPGMRHHISPHFATSRNRDGSVVVPCLKVIFPSLKHLVLRTPISFLFGTNAPEENEVHLGRGYATADYETLFFGNLRANLESLEVDCSESYSFMPPLALEQLPPSLTKLHLKSKIDPNQLRYTLHLSIFAIMLPDLLDLEVIIPFSTTSISVEDDRLAKAVIGMAEADLPARPVHHHAFPPHLTRLSLCIGDTSFYGSMALPSQLESLTLSSMRGRTCPLVFGAGNLFSPVLPDSLKELNMRQISIMSGSIQDWERRTEGSLKPMRLPVSVCRFALSQGDFSPTFSFRSVWPTLSGLKYLTVYDHQEGDVFRYNNLAKANWSALPNLISLDVGSTPITSDRVSAYPEKLTSLRANYDSFRTLTELVARLKDCRFGRCRFPLYADDLTAIYDYASQKALQNNSNMLKIQTELELLRYCTEMLESRVDHVDLQFSADKPVVKRAGEYIWNEKETPLFFGPCNAPGIRFATFMNPATYRTSRVSLHTHFYNPSLYTFVGLRILLFETKTPLTSQLMRSLPPTLMGFDSRQTPIHDTELDLHEIPASLEYLSIGAAPLEEVYASFLGFRKPRLNTLAAPNIMFDPGELAMVFSAPSSIESLDFMMSDCTTDESLLKLSDTLRPMHVHWTVFGTIYLSGLLLPTRIKHVDYKILLESSQDVIDGANLHTTQAIWRPNSTLRFPDSVYSARLEQDALLEMSSSTRDDENRDAVVAPIPLPAVPVDPRFAPSPPVLAVPSRPSTPSKPHSSKVKGSKDTCSARCPIVIAPRIETLSIVSTHSLDITNYLYCLAPSLRALSLDVPVTFVRDNSLLRAQVGHLSTVNQGKSKIVIPQTLETFELSNTDPTATVTIDLISVPTRLSSLILRNACRLAPPLDPHWSHHMLTNLHFPGGSPWTDAQALALQTGLPRDSRIKIDVLGFTGVLSNRAAVHMTWNTMLKDAVTALPRVTVGVFDLHITASLSLDLSRAGYLKSLHLDANSLERPMVVRNERSTIEFLSPNKRSKSAEVGSAPSSTTTSPTKVTLSASDSGIIPIEVDNINQLEGFGDLVNGTEDPEAIPLQVSAQIPPGEAPTSILDDEADVAPVSFLVHADTFHLSRLPNPLPLSLQELEIYNNDEFFPHFRLDHVQNLAISHLVRLVLNVPIRIHERLGDYLPRTLVTLSLPKATEEPSGLPSMVSNLPPRLMYLNLPQLLVHHLSAPNFPRTLKLLKVANADAIYKALASASLDGLIFAQQLWPNGAVDIAPAARPHMRLMAPKALMSARSPPPGFRSPPRPITPKKRKVPKPSVPSAPTIPSPYQRPATPPPTYQRPTTPPPTFESLDWIPIEAPPPAPAAKKSVVVDFISLDSDEE